jgi:ABC-type glycerol-3-phosphate transport system permease component
MAVAVAVILAPYIWMLLTSFKTHQEFRRNPGKILPINWVLSGYATVFTKAPFFYWLRNSALVTGAVTLGVLFTSSITGFVFAKYRFKGKSVLFWLLMSTMMVPAQVMLIPSFLIINEIGLYNTLYALIVPTLVSAFGIFLCKQFCEDIPDSLCEAARIDGASDLYIYSRVIIPLLRPCLAALAIFTFLASWNEYLMPLILLEQTKNMTLPVALSWFTGFHSRDTSAVMAAAALIMTPVTLVFLALQKQFIKGITLIGIKQ